MGINLAVDAIVEKGNKILLITRASEPFKGMLALPGGFVEEGERVEQALIREVEEETSIVVKPKEILGVYSDPERDPRGHTVSIVFVAEVAGGELEAGGDAEEVDWYELKKINLKNLAFDHARILKDYNKWLKKKRTFWSSLEVK
ncbi:MAG: NUDIX hydrolase [Candidatus Aenigmarchaeota archaeon]|nr:NUDIX hydrolase [Candidatus Aenigmarchaeota archaeon]